MRTLKALTLLIVGAISFYACSSGKKDRNEEPAVKVEVYQPSQSGTEGFYLSGEVTAKQTATISTRLMGYINKIYVKPGDRVTAGQLLVFINNDDVMAKKAQTEAMITEAEAAARNAQRDYERFKALHAQQSVSDKELENVALQHTSMQAKAQMARGQMNEIQAMLAYTHIRAPFGGTITRKLMDEGSMATPGMPILQLEQDSELQVLASVPESYIQYVKVGDPVKIEFKSLGTTTNGHVSELSPSAHQTGGQYQLKLVFDTKDNPQVQSGMYAHIFIPNHTSKALPARIMLEASSVIHRDQLTGVYVINDDNRATLRWVRLGKTIGNRVEALSGVSPTDRVVLTAEGKLHNGIKVITSK